MPRGGFPPVKKGAPFGRLNLYYMGATDLKSKMSGVDFLFFFPKAEQKENFS